MADAARVVKTSNTNATEFIAYANAALQEQGILDDAGKPAKFNTYAGSPAWLFAQAYGMIATEWQERLRNAYAALDIWSCADEQVLRLAVLAGVKRLEGTASRVVATFSNNGDREVSLPRGSLFVDSQTNSQWATSTDMFLESDQVMSQSLYCTVNGATSVTAGTTFTNSQYPDLAASALADSTVGTGLESISSLRTRIANGEAATDSIVAAEREIAQLSGIVKCAIYFNPYTNQNLTLAGGVVIPPRQCYVVIQGVDINKQLGETLYKYLDVPTTETATTTMQSYKLGRAELPVYYDVCTEQVVMVQVKVQAGYSLSGYLTEIKAIFMARSGTLDLGSAITEIQASVWLQNCNQSRPLSVDFSLDGLEWADVVTVPPRALPVFDTDSITVIEVTV